MAKEKTMLSTNLSNKFIFLSMRDEGNKLNINRKPGMKNRKGIPKRIRRMLPLNRYKI